MRLVMAIVLPLLLSACGVSLRTHALVASTAGGLLDAAGAEIEREAAEDHDQILADGIDVPQRVRLLQASFQPIEQAYKQAREAWIAYRDAILAGVERGDKTLAQKPARKLLDAWSHVAEVGDAIGVKVPLPPAELLSIATGGVP